MASTPSEAAPPDNLELRLIKLWEEILGVQPITVDGHFFDLGGHSLMAVRLLSAIGEQFGQTLPVSALFQAPTVRQFAHVLRQKGWSSPWSLLVPIQSKGNKPPFFCVPGGDGNVLFFGDLMRQFDADQPFYGIQAQGIDGDRPVLNRIEAIAAANLRELRAFQPQGPYFLGGHSTGGLVAFEMAQQLVAAGQTVGLLALLEPSIPGSSLFRLPFLKQFNYLAALPFLHYLIAQLNHLTYRIEGALGGKIQDDRPQKVLQVSRIMTRIMSGFRADWSQPNAHPAKPDPTATAIWAANTEAMLRYVPRPYSQPIALFLCHETLTQSKALSHWQVLAGDQLEIHRVPGNHKTALQAPHVAVLVQQLTECLQRSQSC
jgi:thioesterase domain-containing protein/acyl carrier protein